MKIGIDIMGGDFAPKKTVYGSVLAKNELFCLKIRFIIDTFYEFHALGMGGVRFVDWIGSDWMSKFWVHFGKFLLL